MAWSVLVGTPASGTGDISPAPNASHASGDIEFLVAETPDGQAAALGTAAGFAAVTNSPIEAAGSSTLGATRMTVYWRRWNGSDGTPTVTDPGNHAIGYIISIRGAIATGNPWDVDPATSSEVNSGDTSVSCPAVTTSTDGCLILCLHAAGLPDSITDGSEFASWTNANLTSLTERVDLSRADGNGGALGAVTGEKAAHGDTGATTATATTGSYRVSMTIALKPVAGTQTPQAIAAGATLTAALVLSTRKPIGVTVTHTVEQIRKTAKTLAAAASITASVLRKLPYHLDTAVTLTAGLARRTAKTIAAATTVGADMVRARVKVMAIAASATLTAALSRRVGKPLGVTATFTVTLVRKISKFVAAGATLAVGIALKTAKAIAAATTFTAGLVRRSSKTIAAGATLTAGLARSIGKPIGAAITATIGMVRRTAKTIAVDLSGVIDLITEKIAGGGNLFYQTIAVVLSFFGPLDSPAGVSGLKAWYDFSDASTLFTDTARTTGVSSDGDTIKGVTDKSGNNNHLSEATNGPTYKTGIQNGRSIARFDGQNDVLRSANITQAQPITAFIVVKHATGTAADWQGIWSGDGYTPCLYIAYIVNEPGKWVLYSPSPGLFDNDIDASWHVLETVFNGASSSIIKDGSSAANGNPGTWGFLDYPLFLGAGQASGSPLEFAPIDVGEFALFSGALSASDTAALGGYFARQWNVGVGGVGLTRKILKPLAVTVTATVGMLKSLPVRIAATVTGTVGLARRTAKSIEAVTTLTVGLLYSKVKVMAIAVTATLTAAMQRMVSKPLAATVTLAANLNRKIVKTIATGITAIIDLIADKIALGETFNQAVDAGVTFTVGLIKRLPVHLDTAITFTVGLLRRIPQRIAATVTFTVVVGKGFGKLIAASVTLTAGMVRGLASAVASLFKRMIAAGRAQETHSAVGSAKKRNIASGSEESV